MAKSRKCDRCGGKASPWIPRKRSDAGDKMLCAGCKQTERSARLASVMKVSEAEAVPDRRPYGSATSGNGTDFGWDDDLAPEGYHPLMAPLPTSVWERYAKKQELRGKPLVPMASQSIINRRMQGDEGKTSSLRTTAHELAPAEHGAHHVTPGAGLTQHLQEAHGVAPAPAAIYGGNPKHHYKLHNEGADHTHGPDGSVIPNAGPAAHSGFGSMSSEDKVKHLVEHHGLPHGGADTIVQSDPDYANKFHSEHHVKPGHSSYELTPHEHTENGKFSLAHPDNMGQQGMNTHLLSHHGISPEHIENASKATSPSVPVAHVLKGLHNKAHSTGFGTDGHEHEHWAGGSFAHQTPHSIEEHTAHLKHAHGMSDSELAEYKSSPFGGAASTLAHVHDDLHSSSITGHEHSGHMDVGKPTVKSGNFSDEIEAHLASSHGLDQSQMDQIVGGHSFGGSSHMQTLNTHHGALHKQLGASADHQHVPTVYPDVKTPEQVAKEAMHHHLKYEHGHQGTIHGNGDFEHAGAHDPEAYGYQGHPGHEHGVTSDPTDITQKLPSTWKTPEPGATDGYGVKSGHPFHYQHAEDMDAGNLKQHMASHHDGGDILSGFLNFDSHETTLQKHAQAHATGKIVTPHSHEISQSGLNEFGRKQYGGKEPEPLSNTHPAVENESDALAHIIKHHPNISAEDYSSKTSMQDFHTKLHTPEGGYALPAAPDGHDHAEPKGPSTGIPIGTHLVSHHGLSQDQVASMTPAEFKAHHEELHARHSELDLGHGHLTPGGAVRDPKSATPNPHHAEMRGNPDHPAVHEWYHGTSGAYDGPPKNATELQEDHGRWGNFGGGDWNNHAGTHWTSLHQMARDFNGGDNRVIHAKLHMSNPITYNSLNHMSHDAYDRLHASGDMEDDGRWTGHHDDDSGYNHCCSDDLLDYAKGGRRSDGKFGMERYRDSLRASGHDGIVVRNQADSPDGHWNAIPLSADQVEVTHASCHGSHGDERDQDVREFRQNESKLTKGWQHPKAFNPKDYTGGKELPDKDDVDGAGAKKSAAPELPHIREGRGNKRGDADPYRLGRDLGGSGGEECEHCQSHSHESDSCDAYHCDHCDEWGNHNSDECDNKWCSVCDEHGGHTADEEHEECEHCGDYADHSSDEHQDKWGEHPDKVRPEGYCPSCETSTKNNYGKTSCTECGEKLPDWGKLASHGTPVKPEDYAENGETDKYDYGPKKNATTNAQKLGVGQEYPLAAHLYHHHKSDVGGKEYEDEDGEFDHDKLAYHHQHLHADPGWAKEQGFEVDHAHPTLYPQYKSHESMTPAEVHAHMLISHAAKKDGGKDGTLPHAELLSMTSAEAVEHHKKLHAAQNAIPWGQKDEDGDMVAKVSHSHQLPDDHPTNAPSEHSPKGADLMDHIASDHGIAAVKGPKFKTAMDQPGVAEAFHQHIHDSATPSADPHNPKFHTHTPEANAVASGKQKMLDHLAEHHGIDEAHAMHGQYQKMNPGELTQAHDQEHHSMFPTGKDPEHTHFGQNPSAEGWVQPHKQASRRATLTDYFEEVTA